MTLSDLSIRRPVFAWMIMAACMIFGIISFLRLGVSQLPDLVQPILTVSINWPGAAPEVLEAEVVNPMEEALMQVQGIKNMQSTLMAGSARIKLEFYWDQDIDAVLQEVNSRVHSISLPDQVLPPTIAKVDSDSTPVLWIGVTWNRSFHDIVEYVDLHLKDKFMIVPGVGDIQLGGWSNRTFRIWIDNEKLKQYQLTVLDIRDTLKADYNEIASGYTENKNQQINVRVMGEERSPEEIANLVISKRGGKQIIDSPIRIRDVATVEDGLDDIRRFSRADGFPTVGLGIRKQHGYNDVRLADDVKKRMEELNQSLPPGMKLSVRFDTTNFTRDSVHETELTLILSVLTTGLVCWIFLGSWSPTINVLLSIPTSLLGAFVVLYFCHFTLNFFTLLALSLAIGIVVDDAIMVLENIHRHFQMGKTRLQAASDGAREITFAAIAATLSVVAIFAPVLFANGMIGVFLFQFGITISAAVLLSLLEAITLTPMRCSQFMKKVEHENRFTQWVARGFDRLAQNYGHLLVLALRHRWKVILGSIGLFALSLLLFPHIRKELSPPMDSGAVIIRFTAKSDSSLAHTSELIQPIESYLKSLPYVKQTFVNVGGFGGGEVTTGNIFTTLVDRDKRNLSQIQIVEELRTHFPSSKNKKDHKSDSKIDTQNSDQKTKKEPRPDAQNLNPTNELNVQVIDLGMGAFSNKRGTTIELSLRGPDYSVLQQKSAEIIKRMEATGEFRDMDTDYRKGAKELHITPDREAAARCNVSVNTIADTLNAAIGGIRVGQYTNGDRRYDFRIRLLPEQWKSPEDVQKLMVRTNNGEIIPIGLVTHQEIVSTVLTLTRENRQRAITLFANNNPKISAEKALQDAIQICHETLPEAYSVQLTGASQTNRESFAGMNMILLMGFLIAYMVLAAQFNSFRHPITVLMALPFTLTGAFLALYITNNSFNLYSGIGIILLMGVAKKNSILLVEFFNKLREEHDEKIDDAILKGGPIRLRPILMTSLATIAAAIPSACGFGPGAEVRVPLAMTVIGGVLISTLFTLIVIPCLYRVMERDQK